MKKTLLFFLLSVFFYSCTKRSTPSSPYALPDAYSNQVTGKSANDLLSAAKYTAIHIELQYMPGYAPDAGAISVVTDYLNSLCNKPAGITIVQTQIAGSGDTLNPSTVALLEKQYRTAYTSGSTIAVYVMITDGYDTSTTTLGISYRNTSICLFGKNIFDHSGGFGQITRAGLEASVLEHELGHLLGLVDAGSPMQSAHRDAAHGSHCSNTACLMHYAIELHKGLGTYSSVPPLDSDCLHDLQANGGK